MSEIWSKMYIGLHVNDPFFLTDCNEILISKYFWKILKYQISLKFVEREHSRSMWTDGRTVRTKPIVPFQNFAEAPKKTTNKEKISCVIWTDRYVQTCRTAIHSLKDKALEVYWPKKKAIMLPAFFRVIARRLNYPEESTQHSEHVKGLKSRKSNKSNGKLLQNRVEIQTGSCETVPK